MLNEKRLIDRNEIFPNETFFANAENPLKSLDELIARIWSIPTVDAVEVVHGHWIFHKVTSWGLWDKSFYECSNCGSRNPLFNFNYCPNCGAKMDGDGNG